MTNINPDLTNLTTEERLDLYYAAKEIVVEARQESASCSYTFGPAMPSLADFNLTMADLERDAAKIQEVTDEDLSDIIPLWDDETPF